MQIDLSQLDPDGHRVEESFDGDALRVEGRRRQPSEVRPRSATLRAWIRPEGPLVRASGSIEGDAAAECDRCLKPVEVRVVGDFDQRYSFEAVTPPETRDAELTLEDDDLDVVDLDSPMLDTEELAREQFILATPIRVVCSEGCEGLCPECGADLNTGACGCAPQTTDSRWDALKNLKLEDRGSDDPETR